MHEAVSATPGWAAVAYLVAGICFILALRGLSSPSSSRRGNRFGMFGMALAMLTTIYLHLNVTIIEIAIEIAIGGVIGNRKSVVWGKGGAVRVDLGGRRTIKKKKK